MSPYEGKSRAARVLPVAIIGAGRAGLTLAIRLRQMGYAVRDADVAWTYHRGLANGHFGSAVERGKLPSS